MRKHLLGGCAVALLAAPSLAQPLVEIEPNDSYAGANFIAAASYPTGAVAIDGVIAPDTTPAGIDFFSFSLVAGDFVAVSVFDNTPDLPDDNDPLLGIFAPGGTVFAFDDDSGPGSLPSYSFFVPTTGTWAFAVTGTGDNSFDGSHQEAFSYKFVFAINPIPGPGAGAILGLAGLVAARRRRPR